MKNGCEGAAGVPLGVRFQVAKRRRGGARPSDVAKETPTLDWLEA